MQVEVGKILEGKVTGIAAFGAFVELPGGKTGLVHISEVSSEYVSNVGDHLKEGQAVKVKVIGMDNGKISLSVKQAEAGAEDARERKRPARRGRDERRNEGGSHRPPEEVVFGRKTTDMSFDDMLQRFKQDSDEKFQDLKRSNDGKRTGGYRRSY